MRRSASCFNRCAVMLLALELSACTVVRPLPPVKDDLYFAAKDRPKPEEYCSPKNGNPECKNPEDYPANYFGNLGTEIWKTDMQRHEYVEFASEKTNLGSLYNAALWPLGAYIGVRTMADPSPSLMRNAGALALATFGVLNSGVPGRDKLYLEASRRLACAITFAGARLYAKSDIVDVSNISEQALRKTGLRASGLDLPTLQRTSETLARARETYDMALKAVLAKLKSTGTGTEASTVDIEQRRRKLYSEGGGTGASGASNIAAFSQHARSRLKTADELARKLDRLYSEVRIGAGDTLRTRSISVRNQLNQALVSNAPSLTDPAEAFAKATDTLNKIIAATTPKTPETTKESTKKATLQGGQPDWELSERTMAGLTQASADQLTWFVTDYEATLDRAIAHAYRWINQDNARMDEARKIARDSNCAESMFDSSGILPLTASPASPPAQDAPK